MATDPKQTSRHDFAFYSKAEYYHNLVSRISKTQKGDRVLLATMSFKPGDPGVQAILQELYAAARRGVVVNFMIDAFPLIMTEGVMPGPLLFSHHTPKHLPRIFQERVEALEKLKASGGQYRIINQPRRPLANPFAARAHIKFAVINDYVFVGGCNLSSTNELDLMAGWQDAHIADWLRTFGQTVMADGSVFKAMNGNDETNAIDDVTTLLVDAGKPDQSLILDQAIKLIDTAEEHILITCQYFPNDITSQHLATAKARGVKIKIIFNHPSKHPVPFNLLHHGVLWSEKRTKPRHFFADQLPKSKDFLHAKLLITDQAAMMGSHNYVRAGVKFGTAEMTLLSHDPLFAQRALQTLEHQLQT